MEVTNLLNALVMYCYCKNLFDIFCEMEGGFYIKFYSKARINNCCMLSITSNAEKLHIRNPIQLLYLISNLIEVHAEPMLWAKKIPHHTVKVEAGEENRIENENCY